MPGPLEAERVINGSYGEIYRESEWLANFNHLEARVEVVKAPIHPSGTRWEKYKVTGLRGSGTISGFKVTSGLIALTKPVRDDADKPVKTELISKLADPEAWGAERIRLKGVSFSQISLANWTTGEHVNEEWPFTFEDYELLDEIVEGSSSGEGGIPPLPPGGGILV